jgi:hypothetical protein
VILNRRKRLLSTIRTSRSGSIHGTHGVNSGDATDNEDEPLEDIRPKPSSFIGVAVSQGRQQGKSSQNEQESASVWSSSTPAFTEGDANKEDGPAKPKRGRPSKKDKEEKAKNA